MKNLTKLIALLLAASTLTLTGCFGGSIADMASGIYMKEGIAKDDAGPYIQFDSVENKWRCGMININNAVPGSFVVNWRRIVLSWGDGNRMVLRAAKDGALEVLSVDAEEEGLFGILGIKAGDRFVRSGRFETAEPEEIINKLLPADEALAWARGAGMTVFEDGFCTSGKEAWREFFLAVRRGESAEAYSASYYTLDKKNVAPEYYEENKDSYPVLFFEKTVYDGEKFTITVRDSSREELDCERSYKYLKHFMGRNSSKALWRYYDSYMLVDDPEATYEGIWSGLLSSSSPDAGFRHYQVYSDRSNEPPLSQFTTREQLEFLHIAGVEFPDGFPAEEHTDFIADVIRRTEEDPYYTPVVSNTAALLAAEGVSEAVNRYYDGLARGDAE